MALARGVLILFLRIDLATVLLTPDEIARLAIALTSISGATSANVPCI
jgi:hypothetical protein